MKVTPIDPIFKIRIPLPKKKESTHIDRKKKRSKDRCRKKNVKLD